MPAAVGTYYEAMQRTARELGLDLNGVELLDRYELPKVKEYADLFFALGLCGGLRNLPGFLGDLVDHQRGIVPVKSDG